MKNISILIALLFSNALLAQPAGHFLTRPEPFDNTLSNKNLPVSLQGIQFPDSIKSFPPSHWDSTFGHQKKPLLSGNSLNKEPGGNIFFVPTMEEIKFWDASLKYWDEDDRISYSYNKKGKATSALYTDYDSIKSELDTFATETFRYDENGNLLEDATTYVQGDTSWDNYAYMYDGNNNLIRKTYKYKNQNIPEWRNDLQYNYMYDKDNNLLQETDLVWSAGDKTWTNWGQYIYDYDSNNNLLRETDLAGIFRESGWANLRQYIYSYDSNNNRIESIYQQWSSKDTGWSNVTMSIFNYDTNDNMTLETIHRWGAHNGVWKKNGRIKNTYDANKNVIRILSSSWNETTGNWVDGNLYVNIYNQFNELTSSTFEGWDAYNGIWDYGNKFVYRYNAKGYLTNYLQLNSYTLTNYDWTNYLQETYINDAYGNVLSELVQFWNPGSYWDDFSWLTFKYKKFFEVSTAVPDMQTGEGGLKCYPDPFSQSFTINYSLNGTENVEIMLSDITGKLISILQSGKESTGTHTINYSNPSLPNGIYLITIRTDDKVFEDKLVKEQ